MVGRSECFPNQAIWDNDASHKRSHNPKLDLNQAQSRTHEAPFQVGLTFPAQNTLVVPQVLTQASVGEKGLKEDGYPCACWTDESRQYSKARLVAWAF